MSNRVSKHYDEEYFNWQASIGEFGGWANRTKFEAYISQADTVLDFGCGGGFLLKGLQCQRRLGVEVNPAAATTAKENGIDVYSCADDVEDASIDVIISNNALEHTLMPLQELQSLYKKLKPGGRIVFVVPCESISFAYKPDDVNRHLFSWSPMCLGNLFDEAGFEVHESKPYIHKWPPRFRWFARLGGRTFFELSCRVWGRLARQWFQVRVVASKPAR